MQGAGGLADGGDVEQPGHGGRRAVEEAAADGGADGQIAAVCGVHVFSQARAAEAGTVD
ncbi:hypothetical protein SCA03_43550 [Streptomyces cacaoi]|uniref:Uncharacterized protein n=1 Tax=Streptomyces cacaoi TaxID=1898 RepID=A0A4Y3R2T1_STRCI|nr:hypothetical protein SCA03_43550 [Streptomyces cacaoi]